MFTPGLAIFYSATILRPGHVCGVECHTYGIVTWQSELSIGHELYPYYLSSDVHDPHHHRELQNSRRSDLI
jgi:hypothetical protein